MSEPLIAWPKPLFELFEFLGAYLAAGAVGFRYAVMGPRSETSAAGPIRDQALRGAAWLGLAGALYGAWHVGSVLPRLAARENVTVGQLLTTAPPAITWVALTALAVVGFALAPVRPGLGWPLAAIGVIAGTLRGAFFGQFAGLAKPAHLLAGGLWIGTLFVLIVVGVPAVWRRAEPRERRGALVAGMVRAFSPLALGMGGLLAACGVVLVFRELERVDQLWSTPYGIALLCKLAVVAVVFGLGAWNWRRLKPRLGDEAAAIALRGSAHRELLAALVVIVITAILASLPSPKG